MHWDPYLHAWVVTRYEDVVTVLHDASPPIAPRRRSTSRRWAHRRSAPIATVMVKQMLFLRRARAHAAAAAGRRRVHARAGRASCASTSRRSPTGWSTTSSRAATGQMDMLADFAEPLPAIVTAEMLGVPVEDHVKLKNWSVTFAEMLGNFQHNPDRLAGVLRGRRGHDRRTSTTRIREQRAHPREGLVNALMTAEVDGDRLTEEEVVANCIVTMVGGLETTTNLIGNGMLTLLRNPDELERLRAEPELMPSRGRGAAALREPQPAHRPARPRRPRARRQADPQGARR